MTALPARRAANRSFLGLARKFPFRLRFLPERGDGTMTQHNPRPEDTRKAREAEKGVEPHESGCAERCDPNLSLPSAERLKITDLQLWIDLSA